MMLALSVLAVGLTGCMPDILNTKPEVKGLKSTAKTVELNNPSSGETVTLASGDTLIITLKGNATTGYVWRVHNRWDETILGDLGNEYVSDPNPFQMSGVGGRREFMFRALQPGTVRLVFSQSRDPSRLEFERDVVIQVTQ